MEKYREKLRIQTTLFAVGAVVLVVVQILAFAQILTPAAGDSHWQAMWNGFIAGAALGVTAIFIFGIVKNLLALNNEAKLKKLYAKEHDERKAQIVSKAQAAGMQATLVLGIAATIVAGYFSAVVGLTILVCTFVVSLITLGFKLYFSLKY